MTKTIIFKLKTLIIFLLCLGVLSFLSGCTPTHTHYDTKKVGMTSDGFGSKSCQFVSTITNLSKSSVVRKVNVKLYYFDANGNQVGDSRVSQDVHLLPGKKTTITHKVYFNVDAVCLKTRKIRHEYKR